MLHACRPIVSIRRETALIPAPTTRVSPAAGSVIPGGILCHVVERLRAKVMRKATESQSENLSPWDYCGFNEINSELASVCAAARFCRRRSPLCVLFCSISPARGQSYVFLTLTLTPNFKQAPSAPNDPPTSHAGTKGLNFGRWRGQMERFGDHLAFLRDPLC